MNSELLRRAEKFYDENKEQYTAFCKVMHALLGKILKREGIEFQDIESRVKTKASYLKKCESEKREALEDVKDIVGLRIVAFLPSDVKKISALIKREFRVMDSEDKSKKLIREKRIGYLSVHLGLKLNFKMAQSEEYRQYKDIYFELQIRTLLQHAWAKFEHDRNYKLTQGLPEEILRKVYLTAAALELVDNQFQSIVDEVEKEKALSEKRTQKGNLKGKISSISLLPYLTNKFPSLMKQETGQQSFHDSDGFLIKELLQFGFVNIEELDEAIDKVADALVTYPYISYRDLIRDVMLITDAESYFKYSWNGAWHVISKFSTKHLQKYVPDIKILFAKNGIWVKKK